MAELQRAIYAEAADITFTDGTRTHSVLQLVKAQVTFSPFMKRSTEEAMYQDGGVDGIFAVHNHLAGSGDISLKLWLTDPLNATDVTTHGIFETLYKNSVTGTGLSTAPWTTTDPTPGAAQFMLDIQIRMSKAASASTHQTAAAAVYVKSWGDYSIENGFYVYDITLGYVEELTWS